MLIIAYVCFLKKCNRINQDTEFVIIMIFTDNFWPENKILDAKKNWIHLQTRNHMAKMIRIIFKKEENIIEKRENDGNNHLLFF